MECIFIAFSVNSSSLGEFFIALTKKLSKKCEIVVFTDDMPETLPDFNSNVKVLKWPSKRPTKLKDAIFLYKKIRKYRPVMSISMFGSVNLMLLLGWLCNVRHRIAWIRTLSTQFHNKPVLVQRKKMIYRLATNILVNSHSTKQDVQNEFHIASHKIKILPNSVKECKVSFEGSHDNIKEIVYVGRLHSSKGINTLIQAFSDSLKIHKDIKLTIAGEGEEHQNLIALTEKLNISENVSFTGRLSKKEVLELMARAYFVVVPSIVEAFGYVTIEAMSVKTAVIGSNSTGIAEIIRDGIDGLLFEPKNSKELGEKMIKLLNDENLNKKLSIQGYQRFLEKFEYQKAVERDFLFFVNLIETSN